MPWDLLSRMLSQGSSSKAGPSHDGSTLGPVAAAEIAMEFASLSSPGACPRGIYMTPSPEALSKWEGVFFVHSGPYSGAILRFVMAFKPDFPHTAPVIRFESEVFHPLIDPKTKVWHPHGPISQWRPRIHHVVHFLSDLRRSFQIAVLDNIMDSEAVNKQIWSQVLPPSATSP
ncbi:ubiquitin-conjugating enzyme/RWD-like protein [Dioszegia hungarica]|uniref:Ubiquitin-conjugating enzyme/RWD-like protein n=1 Tax=Dioszegia hungarica TaxID=4972 RepID=A0AA38LXH4_9TREE|nr:ubiquitin-conjugating enzyme/RWD-like protein [Dioszegia hungarica]KAI9639747.1 ubiquitin-conjugating enzyme/RWD-like protein [Dioszegia hungarica]